MALLTAYQIYRLTGVSLNVVRRRAQMGFYGPPIMRHPGVRLYESDALEKSSGRRFNQEILDRVIQETQPHRKEP